MGDTADFNRTDRPSTAQPPPVHVPGAVSVHDLVIADIAERAAFGLRKYQTPLQVDNGRDPLEDAYEEILDTAAYLRQEIELRRRRRAMHQPVHTTPSSEYRFTPKSSG